MSDGNTYPSKAGSGTNTPAPAAAKEMPKFSEKEEVVLKVAWQCLKSGPPDIDYAKLTELGGFHTQKTCQNTWGVIKKKLMSMAPPTVEGEDGAATPKPKVTPKKRTKKAAAGPAADGDDAAATGSPAKKARTPNKATPKSKVKVEAEEAEVKEEGEE